MITVQEACTIAQGACLEELKYIEDTIRTAAEMHMMSCIIEEEITEAAKQVLKTAGYDVRVFSFHSGYITYINWVKGVIKMWTAEKARKIAEEYKYLEEIQEFDHQILEAVNQGNTYAYYYKKMSQCVKDRFEDLGYTIKISESPESDDGYITFIYW